LTSSNSLQTSLSSLYVQGFEDKTVSFHLTGQKSAATLPVGDYSLSRGTVEYGPARDWQVDFSEGPHGTVKAGEELALALGAPTLKVRAVNESERYNRRASGSAVFKRGERIYLEPKIVGTGSETFRQFRQAVPGKLDKVSRAPKVTITRADGTQVLSSTMEYG
jgi:hypothetical protein